MKKRTVLQGSTALFLALLLFLTACTAPSPDTESQSLVGTEHSTSLSETETESADLPASTDTEEKTDSSETSQPNTGPAELWTEPRDLPEEPLLNPDLTPITPDRYYGRAWLLEQPNGEALVKVYNNLVTGVDAMVESIPMPVSISHFDLITVWECYRADYPQHFWLQGGYKYTRKGNRISAVSPNYLLTEAERDAKQLKFHAAAREMLSGIDRTMTDYDIEKTIHDRLVRNCTYREQTNAHNSYGALVDGVAVCDGYARAFQYLCRAAGIQTLHVYGTSGRGAEEWTSHAWNAVLLDGEFYHVDATWNDSDNMGLYGWFNLSTEQIQEDHEIRQLGYAIPQCNATEENYFEKNSLAFAELEVSDVLDRSEPVENGYRFHAYITSDLNVGAWLKENSGDLAAGYGIQGCYQYVLYQNGREIIVTMTAKN